MAGEIFPNPTVKRVAFEIRFPNLFSIDRNIGDFQEKILREFPESKLIFRRQIVFADIGPEGKLESVPEQIETQGGRKIWRFESKDKHVIEVLTNSLVITSEHHKTYNNPGYEKKFRDVIRFVLTKFFEVFSIPIINRIGLRYIDECPLPSKDNKTLMEHYNSSFPINRYPIDDSVGLYFEIRTKRGNHNLVYRERLVTKNGKYKLVLDFDGYETDVPSEDFLKVTDELHQIIETEYFNTIKEPVIEYMRKGGISDEQKA